MRTRLRTLLAVPAVAALAACGGGDGESDAAADEGAARAEVTVRTFDFQPDPLEVEAGTTILFGNEDKIDHTVTAGTREAPQPEVFDGLMDGQGTTFELTLEEPGTYDYFCTIHAGEGMTGRIIVT